MISTNQKISHYLDAFQKVENSLLGNEIPWLKQFRAKAIAEFENLGFPSTQDEDWRFTEIETITNKKFDLKDKEETDYQKNEIHGSLLGHCSPDKIQLTFINGIFKEDFSKNIKNLPSGLKIKNFKSMIKDEPKTLEKYFNSFERLDSDGFSLLNDAFFNDGLFISLSKGAVLKDEIYLNFITHSSHKDPVVYPRLLCFADRDSELNLVELNLGEVPLNYLALSASELICAENSKINYCKVQKESSSGFHLAKIRAQVQRNSRFYSHSIALGGSMVRNNLNVALAEEGAECVLNGLYLASGQELIDNHTQIEHLKPHTTSRELYKGILNGKSKAVFNGSILVHANAQKTDSLQTNKNLLLSQDCHIHTKPGLKIFANDVKCKHGATVGQMDQDVLFYLRSRGIPKEEAQKLLIVAFASEIIDQIQLETFQNQLTPILFTTLMGKN